MQVVPAPVESPTFTEITRLQQVARAIGVCVQLSPHVVYNPLRTPRDAHNVFRALHEAGIQPQHLAGVRVFADRLEVHLKPTGQVHVDGPRPNATICVVHDRLLEPGREGVTKVSSPDPVLLVRATPGFAEVEDGKEQRALEAVAYALAWFLRQFKVERLDFLAVTSANQLFWSKKLGGPLRFDVRRPLGVRDGLVICAHTTRVAVRAFSIFDVSATVLRCRASWSKIGKLTPPKKGPGVSGYVYTLGRNEDRVYVQVLNRNGVGCRRYFTSLAELGPRLHLKVRPRTVAVRTSPTVKVVTNSVRSRSSVPAAQFTRGVTDLAFRALDQRSRQGSVNQFDLTPVVSPT